MLTSSCCCFLLVFNFWFLWLLEETFFFIVIIVVQLVGKSENWRFGQNYQETWYDYDDQTNKTIIKYRFSNTFNRLLLRLVIEWRRRNFFMFKWSFLRRFFERKSIVSSSNVEQFCDFILKISNFFSFNLDLI